MLLEHRSRDPQQVFEALQALSAYDLSRSRLYRQYPQDVQAVACDVFGQLSEYYEKHRKTTLCEKLFGRLMNGPCRMFESAVFEDTRRYPDYEYVINPLHIYRCKNGVWSAVKFYGAARKSKELGAILKTMDSAMRGPWGLPAIQPGNDTRLLAGMVQKAIDTLQKKKAEEAQAARKAAEEAARPKVALDLSRLSAIRQAAELTRDKLLVEEEPEEGPPLFAAKAPTESPAAEALPEPEHPAPVAAEPVREEQAAFAAEQHPAEQRPAEEVAAENGDGLSVAEYALLHALLYGKGWAAALKPYGILVSVTADAVNEKLFDLFGDTVIVFEDDDPVVLEDYIDELKGMFPL